jgi:hypothetical protein
MKKIIYLLLLIPFVKCSSSKKLTAEQNNDGAKSYYTLQVYHLVTDDQITLVESFLKTAYLPALHRNGISTVGVFKPVDNDTASDKKIIVFTPYKSLQQFAKTTQQLKSDGRLQQASPAYVNAPYKSPPYTRFETILLEAFEKMPSMAVPHLTGERSNRIYELRSYEGPTEKFYQNKLQMFNQGGEVTLFKRLNFNAVFYASVLAGSRMPNLMYMTTFENKADREAHWKSFSSDPDWKILSAKPEYQNNVSKINIQFLTPTEYSDF